MDKVSVVRCENYNQDVKSKILDALKKIGFVFKKNSKVLIKPNILMAKKAAYAVTTHPTIVEAVCNILKDNGCSIIIGESSGWNTAKAFEVSGIKKVAEKYGAKIICFEDVHARMLKNTTIGDMKVTSIIDEVDYIINLPKMKTHTLMTITGAVKNCYGFVPGSNKALYHAKAYNSEIFAKMILDLYSEIKPKIAVNIMDAIIGIQGEGPSNGDPKNTGLILASTDALSLDVVESNIMNINIGFIPHICEAIARNSIKIDDISIVADKELINDINNGVFGYVPPHKSFGISSLVNAAAHILKGDTLIPEVDITKCVKCGICKKVCPVKCITLQLYPTFDRSICIKCYCCQENCPHGAIFLKR